MATTIVYGVIEGRIGKENILMLDGSDNMIYIPLGDFKIGDKVQIEISKVQEEPRRLAAL